MQTKGKKILPTPPSILKKRMMFKPKDSEIDAINDFIQKNHCNAKFIFGTPDPSEIESESCSEDGDDFESKSQI